MIGLIILGILLLLILLVLYTRVGVLIRFGDATTFTLTVGRFKKSLAKKDASQKKGASQKKPVPSNRMAN